MEMGHIVVCTQYKVVDGKGPKTEDSEQERTLQGHRVGFSMLKKEKSCAQKNPQEQEPLQTVVACHCTLYLLSFAICL